ncbi:MAG: hypothetical protein JRJ26_03070 [Deltaproteobacteria bacterium]|nr:hypothetical protein [Deltaproteobacteria bacterium]
MTLKEIVGRCNLSSVYEIRHVTEDYGEVVFYNRDMEEWNTVFLDSLGPPIKPACVEPSEDQRRLAEAYGGIWKNQTLFKREFDGFTLIAMYWPWQDQVHTTVKIARLR